MAAQQYRILGPDNAPWTPVQWQNGAVTLWNKTYSLTGAGIASRIVNSGLPQLSGPMTLEAVVDGRAVTFHHVHSHACPPNSRSRRSRGESRSTNLTVNTSTHVEFDGFVWNSMTVQPTKANVARLSLIVNMPASEAPLFVTTSGGWTSYFGDTPAKWDSRKAALSGMKGSLVPYVFLTDSERGFSVFADNDKGWRLDPALPAQEMERHDGLVTLRVHFINKAGPIDQPLTIHYGWMVTPQKPQPASMARLSHRSKKYYPQSTPVFWNDADWDVLWPYYSSPFPHNYDKSRAMLATEPQRQGVVGCVGNIAHAIARYYGLCRAAHSMPSPPIGAILPVMLSNGDISRSRGPNDFDLFPFRPMVEAIRAWLPLFRRELPRPRTGIISPAAPVFCPTAKYNLATTTLPCVNTTSDLRYMFAANGKHTPNLWEHTTGGQAVYAWMPDVSMEGENVEPTDLSTDYIDMLPSSRLAQYRNGSESGDGAVYHVPGTRHWKPRNFAMALVHQFVGWVLAHDVLPEGVPFWPPLAAELELWRDDVKFLPWWVKGNGIESERLRSYGLRACPARECGVVGRQYEPRR